MCHQWQANSLFVRFCVQIALLENKIQIAKGKRVTYGLPEWLVLGRIPTNSHLVVTPHTVCLAVYMTVSLKNGFRAVLDSGRYLFQSEVNFITSWLIFHISKQIQRGFKRSWCTAALPAIIMGTHINLWFEPARLLPTRAGGFFSLKPVRWSSWVQSVSWSSQPSMVHWLSSPIFPFCPSVRPAMVTSVQISLLVAQHPLTHTFSESLL